MDKKVFVTVIKSKNEHKLSNDYVIGRINGIAYVMCDVCRSDERPYASFRDMQSGRYSFAVECSEAKYSAFAETIEENYPGLCIFNVKE